MFSYIKGAHLIRSVYSPSNTSQSATMQFKSLIITSALLGASAVTAQTKPDPNVDVSVFELRAFSNETAIDGKPIVAKNGFLAVGTTSEANCTGDHAGYDSTTYTQFLIGLTTYNPDGDAQTSKSPRSPSPTTCSFRTSLQHNQTQTTNPNLAVYVGTNGQNLQVAEPGKAPAEDQVPTGFRQIVHWDDKLLQFRGAGFQACPRSNFNEWIVSVQPGALPTSPECNIFDVIIVPKNASTAPSCTYA